MSDYKQHLIDDLVAIEMMDTTKGRIKLPDWQKTLRGTVIGVGPGKMLAGGDRAPMAVKVGDLVSFAATAGMESQYAGAAIRVMHDSDVDAVLESV